MFYMTFIAVMREELSLPLEEETCGEASADKNWSPGGGWWSPLEQDNCPSGVMLVQFECNKVTAGRTEV